jgi:hypothetical protein
MDNLNPQMGRDLVVLVYVRYLAAEPFLPLGKDIEYRHVGCAGAVTV